MRALRNLWIVVVLLLSLTSPASAQYHSQCYLRWKGYPIRGTPLSAGQVNAMITDLSGQYGVPVEILSSCIYLESLWEQWAPDGYLRHNIVECAALYRGESSMFPPGLGLAQMTGGTAKAYDVKRLMTDARYNLEAGVKTLIGKWDAWYRYRCPSYYPNRATDHEKRILENWWYPLKMYNGWANLTSFSYVTGVYDKLWNVPTRIAPYVPRIRITRPWEAVPNYTLPPAAYKYYTYFKASAGHAWVDGYGNRYSMRTHVGTIGTSPGTGPDPVITSLGLTALKCTATTMNVRSGAGASFSIVGTIPGSSVYVSDAESAGWYRIWYKGGVTGWVSGASLARTTGVMGLYIAVSETSVRYGAGTTYSVKGPARWREVYARSSTYGYWSKIHWGGTTGWIPTSSAVVVTF